MKKMCARITVVGALVAMIMSGAVASHATVRWSSFSDDCGPHFTLRVGSQGWSHAESWQHTTLKHDRVNWGYLDYPYYKRSYEIPWWTTQQVYTQASLRWIDRPYLVCYY